MSKTFKHQDTFDYLHDNRKLPKRRLSKLLHYFDRVNFWDWDIKIQCRKHKDFKRGGVVRIKGKNYKRT